MTVGQEPLFLAITGTSVYVANKNDGTVSVIDTASNTVIATVTVGSAPNALAITSNGASVYVANSGGHDVSVIDAASKTVTAIVGVGDSPYAMAAAPSSGPALVVEAAVKSAQGFGIRFKYYKLSWNAFPGATVYKIFRNGILLSQDTHATHYSDTAIDPSESYTYVVDAYSSDRQIGSGQVQIGPL